MPNTLMNDKPIGTHGTPAVHHVATGAAFVMVNDNNNGESSAPAAMLNGSEPECLLRAADLQGQLGLSRAKIYRLMRENVLPTVRIGGSIRVPQKALNKWIEEHTFPGAA